MTKKTEHWWKTIEARKIEIVTIHHINGAGFGNEVVQDVDVIASPNRRECCSQFSPDCKWLAYVSDE